MPFKGIITVENKAFQGTGADNNHKQVVFKNCAAFLDWICEIKVEHQ